MNVYQRSLKWIDSVAKRGFCGVFNGVYHDLSQSNLVIRFFLTILHIQITPDSMVNQHLGIKKNGSGSSGVSAKPQVVAIMIPTSRPTRHVLGAQNVSRDAQMSSRARISKYK